MSLYNTSPAQVHQHGWTHFECHNCYEVIYEGRWINHDDLAEMIKIHGIACAAKVGESTP